ncbi:MAG: prolipoprotein diacylglyceryl transferase [Endomicrobiaceae bacterium]|nr:prolipoprotein diacylglyceryl transferase [Endomicrobiaceae bacterium]
MYPELFSIGKITIYTYGVLVALGFFIGMQYIVKYSKDIITKQQVYDLLFYIILIGIIGARLFYVILDLPYYKSNPLEIFQVWKGGLVYYGGFISVLLFAFLYCKYKKINIVKLMDVFAPALALGHTFGRIGCFFSGCCYGKNTDCFLAISQKHPTQLYEAFGNLIIFFILHNSLKKSHKDGYIFVLYMLLYSILRFFVEFFRGDDRGMFLFGLSPAQNISIIIFVIAIIILFFTKSGAKNEK